VTATRVRIRAKVTPAKPPRKPGTIAQRKAAITRAAKRKAAPSAAVLSAAVVLQAAHAPDGWLLASGLGLAAWYGREGWDAARERRSGGKAAARRRRRHQGFATPREISRNLSVSAARRSARVTRPSFGGRTRRLAAREAGIALAKGGTPARRLYAGFRDCVQVYGTTGSGKSGYLATVALDAPGACVVQSSRPDLRAHTVLGRADEGPVYDFAPGLPGVSGNFGWSPLAGSPLLAAQGIDDSCRDPDIAGHTAGYLMHAAPRNKDGSGAWCDAAAADVLRLMLHAAAVAGGSMLNVLAWARDPYSPDPLEILHERGAAGWAHELATMLAGGGELMQNVSATAAKAVAWMSSPELKAVACPELSGLPALDPAAFLTSSSTLYLCSEDRPHSVVTPFKACLMAKIFDTGRTLAAMSPGMRLDPPCIFVLDEAWKSGLPLEDWMPVAGGYGMPLVTGWQSRAQLAQKYGDAGGKAFWDAAPAKMIFGGYDDASALEDFSAACGMRDTWHHTKNGDGTRGRQNGEERLIPVSRMSRLAEGQVALLYRRTRVVLADAERAWERAGYRGQPAPGWQPPPLPASAPRRETAPAIGPQPAIGPPRREAIPMPPAPPRDAVTAPSAPLTPSLPDGQPAPIEESPAWLTETTRPTAASRTGSASG
jgi:type IV secretion system protein VirD4